SSLVERMAAALLLLGIEKAWIVHGADGLDEITLTGKTFVTECSATNGLREFTITPSDFGLPTQQIDRLRGEGPMENAHIVRAVLDCEKAEEFAAARDLVTANAAAALYIADFAPDLWQAARLARESIETGRAAAKLSALVRETNRKQ